MPTRVQAGDPGPPQDLRPRRCGRRGRPRPARRASSSRCSGPSGSGKTTLLMMVAGLTSSPTGARSGSTARSPPISRASSATSAWCSRATRSSPTSRSSRTSPFRSGCAGCRRQRSRARSGASLEIVRLPGVGERLPRALSGGQQQRVALARCIVYRPSIVLMDEPLGALDKKLRDQMQLEIKHLHTELGITVLYVTHDQEEAMIMSDRICLMNDGRIEQIGPPHELYFRPRTVFAADFLGESNVLDVTVDSGRGRRRVLHGGPAQPSGPRPLPGAPAGRAREAGACRPERLVLLAPGEDAANVLDGVLREVILVGGVTQVLRHPGRRAERCATTRLTAGPPVRSRGGRQGPSWLGAGGAGCSPPRRHDQSRRMPRSWGSDPPPGPICGDRAGAALWPILPLLAFLAVVFRLSRCASSLALSVVDRQRGLQPGPLRRLFASPVYVQVLMITFKVAAWTTLLCLVAGYPVAYLLATPRRNTRGMLILWVLLPFWTSFLVRTFAWIVLLGRNGAVNKWLLRGSGSSMRRRADLQFHRRHDRDDPCPDAARDPDDGFGHAADPDEPGAGGRARWARAAARPSGASTSRCPCPGSPRPGSSSSSPRSASSSRPALLGGPAGDDDHAGDHREDPGHAELGLRRCGLAAPARLAVLVFFLYDRALGLSTLAGAARRSGAARPAIPSVGARLGSGWRRARSVCSPTGWPRPGTALAPWRAPIARASRWGRGAQWAIGLADHRLPRGAELLRGADLVHDRRVHGVAARRLHAEVVRDLLRLASGSAHDPVLPACGPGHRDWSHAARHAGGVRARAPDLPGQDGRPGLRAVAAHPAADDHRGGALLPLRSDRSGRDHAWPRARPHGAGGALRRGHGHGRAEELRRAARPGGGKPGRQSLRGRSGTSRCR